jgi:ADP-ribose pyrophosphatase YjhB (NUDIX family)
VGKNAQNKNLLKKCLWPIGPTARREFSSGGVVYRESKISSSELKVEWLVAATAPSKLYPKIYWRLPKGWIDNKIAEIPGPMAGGKVKADEESLQKAALREVREEGGVEAKIIKKIGTEKYFFNAPDKGRILKFVTFYLMEWIRDLPEGHDEETSETAWLPFEETYKKLSFSGEKQMLKKAQELLAIALSERSESNGPP